MKNRVLTSLLTVLCVGLLGCEPTTQEPSVHKIACIGNSITQGFTLPDDQTYPAQLQNLVSPPNKVLNYGVGGSTVVKKGDKPVWQAEKYGFAIDWKPTIVVIELGTNDSKAVNWQYKNEFKADYAALIQTFRQLRSSPKVYVCIPPPMFREEFELRADVVHNEVVPLVYEVARENNTPVIDLYKLMANRDSLFIDGIHPNREGAAVIAKEVQRVIGVQ
ncbi:sialate O-acetylesterase [Fibrisoma montanum]|uniref:Sialate O-acetylesterase n=1 Tax=Fibrisoma montanum TaxID=2305895 RepID=A0A418LWR2_9BACT|nr:GDSL-type esterase/lipase family protein [Fibrisoma montanum]RIV17661.1 sialate O-acetylesterase [Fibrisoma montanum]